MTVNELLRRMSAAEFSEWEAVYYKVEPFGEFRRDLRSGMATAPLVNLIRAAFGVKDDPAKPTDWVIDLVKDKEKPKQTAEDMAAILMAIAKFDPAKRKKGQWKGGKRKKPNG